MTEATNTPLFDLAGKRVYVAGHAGMVGSALVRRLGAESCTILTVDRPALDLTRQAETEQWIGAAKPDAVILAAAKVGGIAFNNSHPVDFLSDNFAIALNVIGASYAASVKKLLFLGSSCIYPKLAPQPMDEGMLLTGPLEPTNQWYAVAKIAGIKLVEAFRQQYGADFISVMPTNLSLHEARTAGAPTVTIWGTGRPRREFLAVDDFADACVFVLKHYSGSKFLNVGTGQDITIAEFAQLVADVVGYRGRFVFDTSRPDGAPQKLLNVSELTRLGWRAKTPLREGIAAAYTDFLANGGQRSRVQLREDVNTSA